MQRATVSIITKFGKSILPSSYSTTASLPETRPAPVTVEHGKESCLVQLPNEFKLHDLQLGPMLMVSLSRREALIYYRQLKAIRLLETAATQLYRDRLVSGFSPGQETSIVGMHAALRAQDNIVAGHRMHALAYLKNISAEDVLIDLTAKSKHLYSNHCIRDAQLSLATGIALASKYRSEGGVCLTVFGNRAANLGQAFECFNVAQLWQLPMVFVCENTHSVSMGIPYYSRAGCLPGVCVNGEDLLAVRSATEFAIEHVQQRGPLIVELSICRRGTHSMSDPSYPKEEGQPNHCDAIKHFSKLCMEQGLLHPKDLLRIEREVLREVLEAVRSVKIQQSRG